MRTLALALFAAALNACSCGVAPVPDGASEFFGDDASQGDATPGDGNTVADGGTDGRVGPSR